MPWYMSTQIRGSEMPILYGISNYLIVMDRYIVILLSASIPVFNQSASSANARIHIYFYTCTQDSKHSSRGSSIINILLESAPDKGYIRSLMVMLFTRPAPYYGFAKYYRSDGGKTNDSATR